MYPHGSNHQLSLSLVRARVRFVCSPHSSSHTLIQTYSVFRSCLCVAERLSFHEPLLSTCSLTQLNTIAYSSIQQLPVSRQRTHFPVSQSQKPSTISTAPLQTLLPVHAPAYPTGRLPAVFLPFQRWGVLILRSVSHLDAFSGYPFRSPLPGMPLA